MSRNWRLDMPTQTAYVLGRVLYDLHHRPGDLARYNADAMAYLATYALPPELARMIATNDIGALYRAGVNPYVLRAHSLGMRIPEPVYLAALREEVPRG